MRVLIFGASGYLGGLLRVTLEGAGFDVIGASRRPTRHGDLVVDISDGADVGRVVSASSCDCVVNLAGAGVTSSTATANEMWDTNSVGALNIAEAAVASRNCAYVLHVSSALESTTGQKSESGYAESKTSGTDLSRRAYADSGKDFSIVRLHNVYGPRQPAGRFVRDVLHAALNGQELQIRYPERIRDFTFESDVVTHLASVLIERRTSERLEIIGQSLCSLRELVHEVESILGKRSKVLFEASDSIDDGFAIVAAHPDLAEPLLCTTGLREGLTMTLRSMQ